jgi:hypothetical protein
VVYTIIGISRLRRERAREAATQKARVATEEHLGSLVKKRKQLVKKNASGKLLLDSWTEEITHFVAKYIRPTLTRLERSELDQHQADILAIIEMRVQVERAEMAASKAFSGETSAIACSSEEDWYYADAENQAGPVSLKELRGALATYSNAKELLVWCARFSDWKKAAEVPELKVALNPGLRQNRAA